MLVVVLLALTASECFVADDVLSDEDRNETALAVCKELLNETKLQSYEDYIDLVTAKEQLTSRSVLFYGNRSLTVDLDEASSISFKMESQAQGDQQVSVRVNLSLTVYIACQPDGSVKLTRNRTWFDNVTNINAVNLVIHESVSELNVWNDYPDIPHRLFVTTLTDYSNCSITTDNDKTPMIYADRIVMSRNLIQRHTEGSVQLIAYYYVFEVDEDMVTGEVSDLIASYSSAAATGAVQNMGNERTLTEVQRTLWHKFVFIVRIEANVTMGPLRCEVSTIYGVIALNTHDQFGELTFDLQDNVDVNFFCMENVEPSELLGGTLSHKAFVLNGTQAGSLPTEHGGFLFHGKWPYVADLLGKTEVIRIESVMSSTLSVTRTRYVGMRRPMFQYNPVVPLKIVGDDIPVYFKGYDKTMILGNASVGIQIEIDTNCTIQMCTQGKCALRVKSVEPESLPNITGGDESELDIIAHTCSKFGNATDLQVTCENIDIRQAAVPALTGLSLADGGTIFTSYTYPGTFPSLSEVWDRLTEEHTWFVTGTDDATALWNDWNYTLPLIVKNLETLSPEFKKDVMNRFPTVLEKLNVLGHAHIYVARQDVIPFASFYSKNPQKIACLSQDAVLQNWSLSISSSPSPIKNGLRIFGKYAPSFKDFELRNSSLVTVDNNTKCVGLRVGQSPVSTANVIVYTSNETYIEILSAFPEYVTTVTPSNVDSEVNLTNPNSKNVAVLFLDSIPEEKSLHFGNLRNDSNVFVFGIPPLYLETVFEIVALAYQTTTHDQTYYDNVKKLIYPLVENYTQYFPTISITCPRVGSILLAGANYIGSKIDSEHFYALGCRFKSGLSVTSRCTYVDTYSYETLGDVVLNDVVLFPINTTTPDHISITNVTFTKNGVTMFGTSGYYQFLGQQAESFDYSVDTEKIKGQLHLMSFGNSLTFDIEDTTNVKGVKVIMNGGFKTGSFHVADFLPESPLLSIDPDIDTEPEQMDILDRFTSLLRLFAEEETEVTRTNIKVAFTGNWDNVQVDGFFGVSAGDTILTLDDVPANILTNLELNPAFATSVSVSGDPDDILMGPQVITRFAEVNYDIDPSVTITFENLTFARGVPGKVRESSLTVLFNYTEKELVANHVKCSDYSLVNLKSLSIQKSLEMGLVSVLSTTKIQTKEINLTLHYNFASGFPSLAKGQDITPKSIKLFYDGDDTATDIEAYLSKTLTIMRFNSSELCASWQSKVSYESEHADYAGTKGRVHALCNNTVLVLTRRNDSDSDSDKNRIGAIVGGVVGVLAVGAIVAVVVILVLKRKKQRLVYSSTSSASPDTEVL